MSTYSRPNSGRHLQDVAAIRGKMELSFMEKPERQKASDGQRDVHCEDNQDSATSRSSPANGNPGTAFNFGVGELAEEFASLSKRAPLSAPARLSSTSELRVGNGVAAPASVSSNLASTVALTPSRSKGLLPPPLNHLRPLSSFDFGNLTAAAFYPSYVSSANSFPLIPLTNGLNTQGAYTAESSGSSSSLMPLSPQSLQSPTSVSSSSSGYVQSANQTPWLHRPRLLRRFQYWCRVLQRRRRHPMCRYCYECYVHMCMGTNRPIPGVHDRGMWHGHNMRERGLVTCPHLWSTICSHCGATRQFAHTEDYCPLVRNGYHYRHLYPSNRYF